MEGWAEERRNRGAKEVEENEIDFRIYFGGVRVRGCKLHYLCIECSRAVCGRYKRNCFPSRGMGRLAVANCTSTSATGAAARRAGSEMPTLIALLTTDSRLAGLAQAMFNITSIAHQLTPVYPKATTIYQIKSNSSPQFHHSSGSDISFPIFTIGTSKHSQSNLSNCVITPILIL